MGKGGWRKLGIWKEVSGKWRGQVEVSRSMAKIMDLIFRVFIDLKWDRKIDLALRDEE